MDADRLRQAQAPLKARYKERPDDALVTFRAKGRVSQKDLTCTLESGKPGVPSGLHPAAGGDGTKACSGDILLEALVACAGVTLAAVSTSMGIELDDATIIGEGDADFRGTLGVRQGALVGLSRVRLRFDLQADAPPEKLRKLVELTERYCLVLQTLAKPPSLEVHIESGGRAPAVT